MRALLPVVLSALLTGCATEASQPADTAVQGPGSGVDVVAAVYPLAWIAGSIAPAADVTLLNEGGQEAHDLDLTPSQRAAVETADVVVYTGDLGYQPQVERAVDSARGQVVSAAEVAGDQALLAASDDPHSHDAEDGEDEEAHASEEPSPDEAHAEHDGLVDPHLWFDPSIMADVAVATGAAFAAADPDNAEAYEASAARVRDELLVLADDLEATLGQECRFDEAIVSHAAYGYLLQPFGKQQHAISGVGAEGDPSGGALAEIVGEIREQGITHVLAEPVDGRAGAEAVVAETGVTMLEVVPLDAVTEEQADTGLPDLVRAQAASFATALGCE